MIAIIDYGLGNVQAFKDVYNRLNIVSIIAKSTEDLNCATKLILPGVGSFDHAMIKLNESGMRQKIEHLVIENKVPILGVCVGMQMMAISSEEGELKGLGWINAAVKRLNPEKCAILPHMGWNDIIPSPDSKLFNNISADMVFYFLHEYYFDTFESSNIEAISDYNGEFVCAVKTYLGFNSTPKKATISECLF